MADDDPIRTGAALLEREEELALLARLRHLAEAGDGQVVVVEGRAGVGKSALLATVRSGAEAEGFVVCSARGSDLESTYAFGVVRQLFETRVRDQPAWLEGAGASAEPAFGSPAETADPSGYDDVSLSVLHGLYWLVVNAAMDRPVLLVVDDAQWSDLPSLRFLAYLATRVERLRLLVLVGLRTGDRGPGSTLVRTMTQGPSTVPVDLQPLSQAAVTAVLSSRLGAAPGDAFAAACHRVTRGNPLLLHELARAMRAEGIKPASAPVEVVEDLSPRVVSRTVLMRLARLDDQAVELARAISVLGEGGDLGLLAGLTGVSRLAVETATRTLISWEILRPEPPLGFVHPLVRDAVYHDLSPVERESRHALTARLLTEAGRPSEEVAAHAMILPPAGQDWAVAALEESARVALRRGAPENAVAYLRRALAEPPSDGHEARLVLSLGLAEALANDPQAAAEHLRAAYASSTDATVRAHTAEVLARMLIFTDPPDQAVAVARRARADLPDELADARAALTAIDLYAISFGAADDGLALREAGQVPPRGGGPGSRMLAAVRAWDAALTGAPASTCVPWALRALEGHVLVRSDPSFMVNVAAGVLVLADRDEALDVWAAALAEGHSHGSRLTLSGVHLWRGWSWLQRGDLADAEESLRLYHDATMTRAGEDEAGMAYGRSFLARVLAERGDLTGAREVMARAGAPTPGSDGDLQQRRAVTQLLLTEGRWEEALEAVEDVPPRRRPVVNPVWAPFDALAARALIGAGRAAEAVPRARAGLAAARRWGSPSALGPSLRALGQALDADGQDDAVAVLQEAVAATDGTPARLEHAMSLLALGSALRRRRRPSEARPFLERAVGLARTTGAALLVEEATTEVLAAGGRRATRGVTGVEALTPSERRVAVLAAAGRSNRAIAQELFVTPKTVEVHLSNTYRKLGVASRGELARMGL